MGNVGPKFKTELQPATSYSSIQPLQPTSPPDPENEFEALVIGTSLYRRISTVRRFFCLLAAFDVLFMFLIWIIYVKIHYADQSYADAFSQEVLKYSITQSLFDIVVLSLFRLVLIIVAYCVLILSHWWMVSLTTAISVAFLIAKVFLYEWSSSAVLIPVILLILSFVLAWAEAWFLDIKVLPSERRAAKLLAQYINQNVPGRSPALQILGAPSIMSEDDDFYSPPASDTESLNNEDLCPTVQVNVISTLSPQDQALQQVLEQNIHLGLELLVSENWKTERIHKGLIIQSMRLSRMEKSFKFVGTIEASLEQVRQVFQFVGPSNLQPLKSLISSLTVLNTIDEHTNVIHLACPAQTQALVSARDFICVRGQRQQDQRLLMAAKSVASDFSPGQTFIRGQINHCLFVLDPADNHCRLQWLLSVSPKGLLPEYMCTTEITKSMFHFITFLHKYFADTPPQASPSSTDTSLVEVA